MRLLHLSDLHLGKRLCGVSLLQEQRAALQQMIQTVETEQIDAVLIAGDVYDKLLPPSEAVELFDWFLSTLAAQGRSVLIINGNHDSAERLAFGASLLDASGVYLAPVYDGTVRCVTLTDAHGPVDFYLLPFLKPALVRPFFPQVQDYPSAIAAALSGLPRDPDRRNVLLAHQFVAGGSVSESEERTAGGVDAVPVDCLAGFDYVALGHLHRAQSVGQEHIRYGGSPLQYAFSEGEKTMTVVELGARGQLSLRQLPLQPVRALRTLRGSFAELLAGEPTEDYLQIHLTDEQELPDAAARLRSVYPNLLRQDYDNTRTRYQPREEMAPWAEEQTPLEQFLAFYRHQNGHEPTPEQVAYLQQLMERTGGDQR